MKRRERERERESMDCGIDRQLLSTSTPLRGGTTTLSLSLFLPIYLSFSSISVGKKRKKEEEIDLFPTGSNPTSSRRRLVPICQLDRTDSPAVAISCYYKTPQVPFILPLPISKTRSPLSGFYNIKQTAMISIDITTSGRMGQGRNCFRIYNFLF